MANFFDLVWGSIKREAWPTDLKYVKILKKRFVLRCPPACFYGNGPSFRK